MTEEINNTADRESLLKALEKIREQLGAGGYGSDLSDYVSMDDKLIQCKHEIVISLVAMVMEENEEGQTIGTKQVAKQNYHIPVPANKDHHEYLKGFFDFLENCMSTSIEKMENDEDKTNG